LIRQDPSMRDTAKPAFYEWLLQNTKSYTADVSQDWLTILDSLGAEPFV
jgi:hypothetical protein